MTPSPGTYDYDNLLSEAQLKFHKNKAALLAFRYLFSPDIEDRADALDGLRALCWIAKGNLFLPPVTLEEQMGSNDIYNVTRTLIINAIMNILDQYKGGSDTEKLKAVESNTIRYIGHGVRRDLLNELDRRQRILRKALCTATADERLTAAPEAMLDSSSVVARQEDASKYSEFIADNNKDLTAALGQSGVEVLKTEVGLYPKLYESSKTPRGVQADILAALQRREDISARTAERNKAQFLKDARRAIRQNNKVLNEMVDLIAHGNDKDTAVFTFPSPDGRRQRRVKVRTPMRARRWQS